MFLSKMSLFNVIKSFNRLSVQTNLTLRNISTNGPLLFKNTPVLMAEPLKKKKRLDPQIIRAREERKKKKIEKQIRRLEKNARQLKPIEECEVSLTILDERSKRERSLPALSAEIVEKRAILAKKWTVFKREQHLSDVQMVDKLFFSQQKALDALREESEDLYQEAIQPDFLLLPFKSEGPLETPRVKDFEANDGDYKDISKQWG